jgi:hypothetical protein
MRHGANALVLLSLLWSCSIRPDSCDCDPAIADVIAAAADDRLGADNISDILAMLAKTGFVSVIPFEERVPDLPGVFRWQDRTHFCSIEILPGARLPDGGFTWQHIRFSMTPSDRTCAATMLRSWLRSASLAGKSDLEELLKNGGIRQMTLDPYGRYRADLDLRRYGSRWSASMIIARGSVIRSH